MKKYKLIIALMLYACILSSCKIDSNKQVNEGKDENEYYTSEEIGWTIQIPSGWTVLLKNHLVEETSDTFVDNSGLKQLISFQKNKENVFQSKYEPVEFEYEGEYEEANQFLKQIITEAYSIQGIKVDTTSLTARIDNLEFDVFKIKIYNSQGELILNQEMYNRLINNYMFSVGLSYNNFDDKNEMMYVWTNSKFKK